VLCVCQLLLFSDAVLEEKGCGCGGIHLQAGRPACLAAPGAEGGLSQITQVVEFLCLADRAGPVPCRSMTEGTSGARFAVEGHIPSIPVHPGFGNLDAGQLGRVLRLFLGVSDALGSEDLAGQIDLGLDCWGDVDLVHVTLLVFGRAPSLEVSSVRFCVRLRSAPGGEGMGREAREGAGGSPPPPISRRRRPAPPSAAPPRRPRSMARDGVGGG